MLIGEGGEEKETAIDKVKLLTIGTRFGVARADQSCTVCLQSI